MAAYSLIAARMCSSAARCITRTSLTGANRSHAHDGRDHDPHPPVCRASRRHGGHTGAFILNSGDVGLLRSLDKRSPAEASRSVNDGATIAAHAQHVRFGLSLMNRWAAEGGDPFADARWDEAWKTFEVDAPTWNAIRNDLRDEARRWLMALGVPRDVSGVEFTGMIASIAHLAYHVGAIRQITKDGRGPREGTYS